MPAITSATINAFYQFDVAEQIDLTALRAAIGSGAINARLTTKSAAPSYLQYSAPPVIVEGDGLDITDVDGFKLRVKFFDYGVLSLALSRPFSGEWEALLGLSQLYIENAELERHAEKIARGVSERFAAVMSSSRTTFLSEDYLVVAVTGFSTPTTAEGLDRRALGRDRPPPARRASGAQPPGTRRDHEQPPLVSRRRSRRPDMERGVRLRHRTRRAGGARDRRVRQLSAPRVPGTTTSCSTSSSGGSTRRSRSRSGSRTWRDADTSPRRSTCTRSSSTSTRLRIAPRTRSRWSATCTPPGSST